MLLYADKLIGFLLAIFFKGEGVQNLLILQISIVMLILYCFRTKFFGGNVSEKGGAFCHFGRKPAKIEMFPELQQSFRLRTCDSC